MKRILSKSIQSLYIAVGFLFILIGAIGIFLPLLPTTPFLLLAAFCLSRGSKKFHNWLLNHKVLGPPILDWNRNKIIRPRHKAMAVIMILLTSLVVFLKPTIPFAGKMAYLALILGVLSFILTRKSR